MRWIGSTSFIARSAASRAAFLLSQILAKQKGLAGGAGWIRTRGGMCLRKIGRNISDAVSWTPGSQNPTLCVTIMHEEK
jgi:hypothetical protein